jgi:predicted NBD/HSP70 family sugar kinase
VKYFAGCDVGSTTGEAAVLDESGKIIAHSIIPSTIDPEITARESLNQALMEIDAQLFINRFRTDGIEVLELEREYARGGVGQLHTRVQAFMEMLGK